MGEFEAACNRGEILTKEEQKAAAIQEMEEQKRQQEEQRKKPTFNEYVEIFLHEKAATLSATTVHSYRQSLKPPAAVFGDMKMESIDFLMVKQPAHMHSYGKVCFIYMFSLRLFNDYMRGNHFRKIIHY